MAFFKGDAAYVMSLIQRLGPLLRRQVVKLTEAQSEKPEDIERIVLRALFDKGVIVKQPGNHIAFCKGDKVDERMITAVWALIPFAHALDDGCLMAASMPGKIWFLSEGVEYIIYVPVKGLEAELRMIEPTKNTRHIICLDSYEDLETILPYIDKLPSEQVVIAQVPVMRGNTTPHVTYKKLTQFFK